MVCQGHEIDGKKKAGSGNLTSRLSGGCFPSGQEGAPSRPLGKHPPDSREDSFRIFSVQAIFQIFRDVPNYPDLKQSRFGARINKKTRQREVSVLDSQKKLPDYQSIRIQSQPHYTCSDGIVAGMHSICDKWFKSLKWHARQKEYG